jgi:hypothetical protein
MDDSTITTEQKQEVQEPNEKQTNRTFSQSEMDKMVGEAIKKEREKLGDIESIKVELEELRKEKKTSELAKLDEVERLKVQLEEQEATKLEKEKEIYTFKKKIALNELLGDSKYSKMPSAYKKLVNYSDDNEEMLKSADNALAEFEKDMGGSIKDTFGIPSDSSVNPIKSARTVIKGAGDMQAALKAQIAEKLNRK